jgi:hypothetical protein
VSCAIGVAGSKAAFCAGSTVARMQQITVRRHPLHTLVGREFS